MTRQSVVLVALIIGLSGTAVWVSFRLGPGAYTLFGFLAVITALMLGIVSVLAWRGGRSW